MTDGKFKPGESGNPNGRPKGSKNKATLEVERTLGELGCDPISAMAVIAMNKKNDLNLRANMYKELAQYIAPKRKATEISGPNDEALPVMNIIDD